jgi:putative ABC transport system permease protein
MLRQTPVVTAAAVLTLGLGVGGSTAAFSLVHAVILNPLPYSDPDRLIELFETSPANASFRVSGPNYRSWAERTGSFEALAAFNGVTLNLAHEGEPERLIGTAVTASMFQVLGIGPLAGRPLLTDDERPGSQRVALLAEALWRRRFGGDPSIVGRSIVLNGERYQVGDVRGSEGVARGGGPEREPGTAIYFSATQFPQRSMTVLVRVDGELSAIVPAIRNAVRLIDPGQPIYAVRSLDEWLDESAAQPRLTTMLAGAFAFAAVMLAVVGVYGVLAYSVGQRTNEIGVRMALGARRGQVVRLVLRGGMTPAGIGIALGLAGALAVSRVVAGLLFEMPARDPATYAAVAITLAFVALAACCVPAARATRSSPALALRSE